MTDQTDGGTGVQGVKNLWNDMSLNAPVSSKHKPLVEAPVLLEDIADTWKECVSSPSIRRLGIDDITKEEVDEILTLKMETDEKGVYQPVALSKAPAPKDFLVCKPMGDKDIIAPFATAEEIEEVMRDDCPLFKKKDKRTVKTS